MKKRLRLDDLHADGQFISLGKYSLMKKRLRPCWSNLYRSDCLSGKVFADEEAIETLTERNGANLLIPGKVFADEEAIETG